MKKFLNIFFHKNDLKKTSYKQSDIHNYLKKFFSRQEYYKKNESQLNNKIKENNINVIINDNMAYWISKNIFYTSNLVDGKPNIKDASPVNTDNMSKKELDKMLFILDNLIGGNDEYRSSGN